MKSPTLRLVILALALMAALALGPQPVRFSYVDVYVDSGDRPLAAYQVDIAATSGNVRLVGLEGGDPGPFAVMPYYDPRALHEDRGRDRIIIGSFDTAAAVPTGKTRVARLHVQITGDRPPEYRVTLVTAATISGQTINATPSITQGDDK